MTLFHSFHIRVMRRLQMFGWTLSEIGQVWGETRITVFHAISGRV